MNKMVGRILVVQIEIERQEFFFQGCVNLIPFFKQKMCKVCVRL